METKELKIQVPAGYEIDKENSTFECIKLKKKLKKNKEVNIWRDIKCINGVYIDINSELEPVEEILSGEDGDENIFLTEKYAKAALALAQISQLMPYYGGQITNEEWESDEWKYSITVDRNEIAFCSSTHIKYLIAFHTEEQRDRFLSFPENVQLVKDLYMVD